jgi:hypothetical protein
MEVSRNWKVKCEGCGFVNVNTDTHALSAAVYPSQEVYVHFDCSVCHQRGSQKVPTGLNPAQYLSVLAMLDRPIVAMPPAEKPTELPPLDLDDLIDLHRDMDAVVEKLTEKP